jgi:serine/threonine-protein kinase
VSVGLAPGAVGLAPGAVGLAPGAVGLAPEAVGLAPGANPTIAIYNASDVKSYNATNSVASY